MSHIQQSARYRRTKIIATMGPASCSPEGVAELIRSGVNIFRLNFSHGSHEMHGQYLSTIRDVSTKLNIPVAVLQDLSGPKIRISAVQDEFAIIKDSSTVILKKSQGEKSGPENIFVEGLDPCAVLKPNQQVLLADGIIELASTTVSKDQVTCRVVKGGRIRSRVGIAFPDSEISLPAATDKDLTDLAWGIERGVDFVAISFVQNAQDILRVRECIQKAGGDIPIIAKIERKAALVNIEEILDVCDGLMVARGDLGLELPIEQLPRLQRSLIHKSNRRGIPVIVATQMLHSMITSVRPTRAEVSDVAGAVMSGADAVMLSEETTIGEHPIECVRYLSLIAREAEQSFEFEEYKLRLDSRDQTEVPEAVAYAACAAAVKVKAAAIIVCTETGLSARLVAKYRPSQPLYGISSNPATLRRMCLPWGVQPIAAVSASSHEAEIETALRIVQTREGLPNGSHAIITGGLLVRTPGATSIMEIKEMRAG